MGWTVPFPIKTIDLELDLNSFQFQCVKAVRRHLFLLLLLLLAVKRVFYPREILENQSGKKKSSTTFQEIQRHVALLRIICKSVNSPPPRHQKQDSATLDMERANKEIDVLRKQCEAISQELKEALQEAEVAKCRRDWAFQERDKIVAERESIR